MVAELSPKQKLSIVQALDTPAPGCVWHGSVRAGKTLASQLVWLARCAEGPPGPMLMVGKTLETLERNVVQPMMDMLPPGAIRHTRLSTVARMLGRIVYLVGAADNTAENRIRGLTLADAYVDEASLLPKNFWPMLRTRLSVDGAKLFATTNPDNPRHWLKTDVIDRADQTGWVTWKFQLADNPALPPAYVQQLKNEMQGLFYRRYILGEWVAAEGAIYDMLDLDQHGKHRVGWEQVPPLDGFLLGVDVGTTNPTHAVLLGVGEWGHEQIPRLYVVGEWRWNSRLQQRQLTDAQQEQQISDWLAAGAGIPVPKLLPGEQIARIRRRTGADPVVPIQPGRVGVDPVAASFRAQLAMAGWPSVARPGTDKVVDGIRAVSSLLGSGRLLFVDGAAPELEQELLGYSWDEKAAERGDDVPIKVDDHGPDALRYAVMAGRSVWRGWTAEQLTPAA